MSVRGIEAAVQRTVEKLTTDKDLQSDVKAAFLDLLDRVLTDAGARNSLNTNGATVVPAATTLFPTMKAAEAPVAVEPEPSAEATPAAPAPASTGRPLTSAFAHQYLLDPSLPAFEQLPELEAGDPRYNEREAMLRSRLDVGALERRLRASAESLGIAYSPEDLSGVLRNAGYDAVHMGSSERYMAAIEHAMLSAEATHRRGAFNIPGAA
jgi:hypothetical protein